MNVLCPTLKAWIRPERSCHQRCSQVVLDAEVLKGGRLIEWNFEREQKNKLVLMTRLGRVGGVENCTKGCEVEVVLEFLDCSLFAEPSNKRHPIWLYYLERTNIVNVFRSLFRSFLTTDKQMSLTAFEDKTLVDKLLETMNYVFPVENSTVTRQYGQEQLRWNIYQRAFEYDDRTKAFPRSSSFNSNFHSLQESIFLNIARAIWIREHIPKDCRSI